MGEILKRRLMQSGFDSAVQEAVLNLLVAAAHIRGRLDRSCADHEVTHAQYNVLRILRGARPGGYPRCEIARRMIERAPDLTRLIDRLEQRGLVERARSLKDRRHSVTRITRRGLDLLERMQPAIEALHRELSTRLSASETRELSRILERLYGKD